MRILLATALLCAAACREPLVLSLDASAGAPLDGGDAGAGDDGPPPPRCSAEPDCPSCCSDEFESGALDFQSALQACACQPSTCRAACAGTLCGTGLALDAACRACLDGVRAPGGACHDADVECVETDGACGAFESCLDRCPR